MLYSKPPEGPAATKPVPSDTDNPAGSPITTAGAVPPSEKMIFAPSDPQYLAATLSRSCLAPDPFTQFHGWYKAALTNTPQPEATILSTAHLPSGRVSARTVYLKELDERGFVVYSNLDTSRKIEDLRSNPHASLTFYWREAERQVRVEGLWERVSVEEAQRYFDTRARGSRIGAHASRQSTVLASREELEERVRAMEEKLKDVDKIPVPDGWGGIRIKPLRVEFWQGRQSRLHDRFVYERQALEEEEWKVERISP